MKNYLIILFLVILFPSCMSQQKSSKAIADTVPAWLIERIEEFISNNPDGKGQVEEFLYREQTVYMLDFCVGCPDNLVFVYNKEEEVVCEFGGLAGTNSCPDFSEESISKGMVWPK